MNIGQTGILFSQAGGTLIQSLSEFNHGSLVHFPRKSGGDKLGRKPVLCTQV